MFEGFYEDSVVFIPNIIPQRGILFKITAQCMDSSNLDVYSDEMTSLVAYVKL